MCADDKKNKIQQTTMAALDILYVRKKRAHFRASVAAVALLILGNLAFSKKNF